MQDPAAAQPPVPPPVLPGAASSSSLPTGLPTSPRQPTLPPIAPDAKLAQPRPADKVQNTFERLATLLVDQAEAQGQRLSSSLNEAPTGSVKLNPDQAHEMYTFSPFGAAAPENFWRVHDATLADSLAQGMDPTAAHTAAERQALDSTYPYRAELASLDTLAPEQRVQRAEDLARLNARMHDQGKTPQAMGTMTTPSALQTPDGEAGPLQGGSYGGPS